MISRIGQNWEITVNWKELQRIGQFGTPWLVNLLLKKKTQEEDGQLTSTAGRRWLRSSNVATCKVPRTRASLGDRSFTVAGPRLWNNLPVHLYVTLNILSWTSAGYGRRTCFAEDWGAYNCLLFVRLINLHLHYITCFGITKINLTAAIVWNLLVKYVYHKDRWFVRKNDALSAYD